MISHGPAGTVQAFWRRPRFWLLVVSNPLWITLTAPARWLLEPGQRFGHRGWRGPPTELREPRRPNRLDRHAVNENARPGTVIQ
jgi:hypothetical protein